jgi:hypothetical protein
MIKACKHCGIEFDVHSRRKKFVGGYINECPDCVEENGGDHSAPKHFGVTGSCGTVAVRKFEDEEDRKQFQKDYNSTQTIKDFL